MSGENHAENITMVSFDYSPQAQQTQEKAMLALIEQEMANTTDTLYLLIDPVPLVLQPDTTFCDRLVARKPVPVSLPHKAISMQDYPWLVPLDLSREDDRQLLSQSITVALDEIHPDKLCRKMGRAVCGWLTSPHPVDDVAKQLGHTAIQQQPDHRMMRMRYYDPAVNSVLWPVLEDFRQQRLMGILSRWMLVDGDGQPVIRRHRADSALHLTFLLGLSQAQTDFILHDAGIINRALRRYLGWRYDARISLTFPRRLLPAPRLSVREREDSVYMGYSFLLGHDQDDTGPDPEMPEVVTVKLGRYEGLQKNPVRREVTEVED